MEILKNPASPFYAHPTNEQITAAVATIPVAEVKAVWDTLPQEVKDKVDQSQLSEEQKAALNPPLPQPTTSGTKGGAGFMGNRQQRTLSRISN